MSDQQRGCLTGTIALLLVLAVVVAMLISAGPGIGDLADWDRQQNVESR